MGSGRRDASSTAVTTRYRHAGHAHFAAQLLAHVYRCQGFTLSRTVRRALLGGYEIHFF